MARIKVKDLPRDMKISKDEMKRVKGGLTFLSSPTYVKLTTSPEIKWETTLQDTSLTDLNLGKIDTLYK